MALSGLAMLADTLRETSRGASQCSGDSDDSGLLALSAAADDVEEKPPKDPAESLKLYAAAVEKEVNLQLESLRYGQMILPASEMSADPIAEIKEIVSQAMDATKRRLGRGTVITTTILLHAAGGRSSNNPSTANSGLPSSMASLMAMPSCG